MPRQNVNELKDGDNVDEVYLLADKQLRANRNANLYLLAQLRDRTGLISGLMWNVSEESAGGFGAGEFVRVKGKVQVYQGGLQMILTRIQPVPEEGLNPADFQPTIQKDVAQLMSRAREILLSIGDPHLRSLMECYLIDEPLMQAFARAPAGVKTHHAYHGGLLEHVVNILETAHRIVDLYPQLNGDLLLAGVFLHDIGKVREMEYETGFLYTDEGQLLGHLVIAIEMLSEKTRQVADLTGEPFPEELELRLKHMILSHHGSYEFGSPKLPMTPEAVALHHLDNLDAKVHEFSQAIGEDPNADSHWTPFNARLGRKLFKGAPDAFKGASEPAE